MPFVRVTPKRVLLTATGVAGAVLYVWVAAVRAVPAIRSRKAARRASREQPL